MKHARFIALAVIAATTVAGLGPSHSAALAREDADESALFARRGAEHAAAPQPGAPDAETRSRVTASLAVLPLCFEQNVGQSHADVVFLARGAGYSLFLTPSQMVLALPHGADRSQDADEQAKAGRGHAAWPGQQRLSEPLPPAVLRMRLEGASPSDLVGEEQLETRTNYFIGNDPEQWHRDVPTFARIRSADVYPGVDVVYYGNQGQLEYDFVVAPGADPSRIVMAWEGAESIEVDEAGALILNVPGGQVRQSAPLLYQEAGAAKAAVAGAYTVDGGGRVGLRLGAYDPSKPLVIDPVLVYDNVLGGSGLDWGGDIAVDVDGAVFITGGTSSYNFPTSDDAYDDSYNLDQDAFVTKLNAEGTVRLYSTFLGGSPGEGVTSGTDRGSAIAVDSARCAYITGYTDSEDFPTFKAFDSSFNVGAPDGYGTSDAFVTKLNDAGNDLVYSSYLGGGAYDYGCDIALDPYRAAYVTGATWAHDFPTTPGAFDRTFDGDGGTVFDGDSDAFVTKFEIGFRPSSRLRVVYSTFLGHTEGESGLGIAVDSSRSAYVTGNTESEHFPTRSAFDSTFNGTNPHGYGWGDAFVAKLNALGNALTYSTFLGGGSDDFGTAIALDSSGAAYVTGGTFSTILFTGTPPVGGFDHSHNGKSDAFVAKVSAAGTRLLYFTYLGGSDSDEGTNIAVDANGEAFVTGYTHSTDFPKVNAVDTTLGGLADAFVTRLTASADGMVYSTLWGKGAFDGGNGIALGASGEAYVTGGTEPTGFVPAGMAGMNAFVLRLD